MTYRRARSLSKILVLVLLIAVAASVSACGIGRASSKPSAKVQAEIARLTSIYARLVDIGDDLALRLEVAVHRIEAPPADLQKRIRAHQLLLSTAQATVWNVSEPNPVVALMDMTTLATLSRRMLEETGEEAFGDDNAALIAVFQRSEEDLWTLVNDWLSPAEAEHLRDAIERWERDNELQLLGVATVRLADFADARLNTRSGSRSGSGGRDPGPLLSLLSFDPLAGLDPAVREIEQTRMLAERALYQAQRMTRLARWEAEALALDSLAQPEVQAALRSFNEIGSSAESLSKTAEKLPELIEGERAAAFESLDKAGDSWLDGLLWRALIVIGIAAVLRFLVQMLTRRRA